jgi:hypothetical protein
VLAILGDMRSTVLKPAEPVASVASGTPPVGGPLFPIGIGLLSMFAALGLLAAWPTVLMLVAVVLVMLVASGVMMFWLGHLLSDDAVR